MNTSYKEKHTSEEQDGNEPIRLPALGKVGFGIDDSNDNDTMRLVERVKRKVRTQSMPEREGDNLILYRTQNFFLRTAYRSEKRIEPQQDTHEDAVELQGERKGLPSTSGTREDMEGLHGEREGLPSTSNAHKNVGETLAVSLPTVQPMPIKRRIPIPSWFESLVMLVGLLITGVTHALNMFNFPRYELDEGTYMASASAILHGQLWPYAYGYGHPPIAWMQIAAWVELTGGFFTFGNALNSGRVLMLFYALGCSLLVYLIARRLGVGRGISLLAMLLFSLSPLSITYQRQVLLDNVATFWLLLSLYLLVIGNSRLKYIVFSALALGVSFLSKEVFLLFMPAMVYAVWLYTTHFQRKFAVVAFTYTMIAVSSGFILLAVLKGELFPMGWLPWDHNTHLSLIGTLIGQTQRTQAQGSLASSFSNWLYGDNVLMIASIVAIAFNLAVGWWRRKQLLLALLALSFWLLLLRGGVVLSFYLIPLIPLLALNSALMAHTLVGWLGALVRFDAVRVVLTLCIIALMVPYDLQHSGIIFTQHPTSAQNEAITWVRQHVPHNDFIVINSYLYMDLREPGGAGVGDGATYPYAHVYQNVASDPAIKNVLLANNWDRIDYIVADSEMLSDIRADKATFKIIDDALNSSILRAEFRSQDHDTDLVIQVFEVHHKYPHPVVSAPHNDNVGQTVVASQPRERRLYGA